MSESRQQKMVERLREWSKNSLLDGVRLDGKSPRLQEELSVAAYMLETCALSSTALVPLRMEEDVLLKYLREHVPNKYLTTYDALVDRITLSATAAVSAMVSLNVVRASTCAKFPKRTVGYCANQIARGRLDRCDLCQAARDAASNDIKGERHG